MQDQEILNLLQELKRKYPEHREPTTEYKQSAFRQAWCGKRESNYSKNNITWMSLGYYMNERFGSQSDINEVYRVLADEFQQTDAKK